MYGESCADLDPDHQTFLMSLACVPPSYFGSSGHEVSTESGPGSPRGQPAWGGGCDRVMICAIVISRELRPVATAPGTDLILNLYVICSDARLIASRIRT